MPFAGGFAATANGALLFSIAAAFLYFLMLDRPPSWRRTAAKAMAVGLLALLAFEQGGPTLLVAGLALGALGDAMLAQEGERPFLAGLASFLAAHLAYAALFAGAGDVSALAEPQRALGAFAMVLFAAGLLARLWRAPEPTMRAPVAAYAAAILAMGISALTLPVPPVILGAMLFIASDGVLAVERFLLPPASPQRAWTGKAVWLLYYAAQVLIALGVLLA